MVWNWLGNVSDVLRDSYCRIWPALLVAQKKFILLVINKT
ncbi:hypothetical protein EC2871950_5328 [Escherichia coli 2871950]|nr:hypothetical protein EC2871950_5328 [Escherichia coli 2871950]